VLYRSVSKRRLAWLLLKDTVDSCMEYRVTGLAAEAAFFVLLSLPPLLLGLVGALGYLDAVIRADTIDHIRHNIISASGTVLSSRGEDQLVKPLVNEVFARGRPDIVSIGFVIALWSGSRAVNVFVDTITIMYGLEGRRGIVRTRLLSFLLYVVALIVGAIVMPLVVAGPDAVVGLLPWSAVVVRVVYWPVVLVLSVVFLTTLYHVSVPVRYRWYDDMPGAFVALLLWVIGSILLRVYLTHTVEGPTLYGSLAAPVAVLLWIGLSAFVVLIGAAVNAAVDRVWPSIDTAIARQESALALESALAAALAEAQARRAAGHGPGSSPAGLAPGPADDDTREIGIPGSGDAPSEFPERWAGFLPHEDIRSRLRVRRMGQAPWRLPPGDGGGGVDSGDASGGPKGRPPRGGG
jgi:membrane protein